MKMTIYVPDDLKDQMEKVKDEVNWSALACRAFREKVVELRSQQKGEMDVEQVIQRLRVSKEKEQDEFFKKGFLLGQKWASQKAEVSELRALAEADNRPNGWDLEYEEENAALNFYLIIRPEYVPSRYTKADWLEFWKTVIDGPIEPVLDKPGFVHGFAEGAASVWDQVADKL